MTPPSADTLSYLMYAVFALGGLGIYFALPQEGRWPKRTGLILSLAALVGLFVLLGRSFILPAGTDAYFYICAAIALFGAARVITHHKPVYSAAYFVLVVVAVAGLAVLADAEFLAAALIIIYAGAILVTYAFVLMLAQAGTGANYDNQSHGPLGGVVAGFVLTGLITGALADLPTAPPAGAEIGALVAETTETEGVALPAGNTAAVGSVLMGKYVMPLEIGGMLLLIAMVGAVAIAKKPIPAEDRAAREGPRAEEPGAVGRRVKPFHDFLGAEPGEQQDGS